jgi:hypothetical protein
VQARRALAAKKRKAWVNPFKHKNKGTSQLAIDTGGLLDAAGEEKLGEIVRRIAARKIQVRAAACTYC